MQIALPNRPVWVIAAFVLAAHMVLLLWGYIQLPAHTTKQTHRKVSVQTVSLQPRSTPTTAATPATKAPAAPKKTTTKKKEAAPAKPKPKPAPAQPDPIPAPLNPNLAKIKLPALSSTLPELSDSLASINDGPLSYREELAILLKSHLLFPEYGAVTVKLTLERNGKVAKVEIVRADSSANKIYIESMLPSIRFPPTGTNQQSFIITLNNE